MSLPEEAQDVRTQLVEKATQRFSAITRENGYQTDIGAHVFCWRKAPMDEHSIPGLVFRDEEGRLNNGEQGDGDVPIGMWEHHLKLPVDIHFKGGTSASEARKALCDVVAAVFPPGDKVGIWDGLAESTDLVGHAINTAQEGEVICGAHLIFIIIYQTPLGTL